MKLNLRAALDAEGACRKALAAALADYGEGYVGAPRLTGGVLAGINCWWLAVGGGPSTRGAPNSTPAALDMDARIEGIFADRHRGWEFAFAAISVMPIKGAGNVQTLYLNGNPSNEYDYFAIAGREGKSGLWRVTVPCRIVFNCQEGTP